MAEGVMNATHSRPEAPFRNLDKKFPPLNEVNKTLKITWYRPKLAPSELKGFTARSDLKGSAQAFGHLLLFLATGTLSYVMWFHGIWLAFAAALFLHGTVSSFFIGAANHELGHGTVFKTKWLNKVFLYIFSTIGWWNHFDYSLSHTYHHRNTLHPEGDREVVLPLTPDLGIFTLIQIFTIKLYSRPRRTFSKGGFINAVLDTVRAAQGRKPSPITPRDEWLGAIHDAHPKQAKKSTAWSLWLILFHTAIVAASIATGQWIFVLLITTASFTANWASYFAGLTQHCGLRDSVPDFRKNSRSIRLGPVLGFLYWQMHWHVEHHLYAAVPCYNLKALSARISSDLPERNSLIAAWKEMRDIWKRQKKDPEYHYDVPVPTKTENADSSAAESSELEKTVGDLATDQ